MQTEFIRTDHFYDAVMAANTDSEREQLYLQHFVRPWTDMHRMMTAYLPNGSDDPLAGARAWNWLLPDQLTTEPPTLAALKAADAWATGAAAMQAAAQRFAPYSDRLGIEKITGWLVVGDPDKSDKAMRGYTGAIDWMQPRIIGQFDTVTDDNLPKLGGLIAHEMHHLIRQRATPWNFPNISVADYIVLEGTAEAFAASIFGEGAITFFATETSADDLAVAKAIMREGINRTGFDVVRGYIFGDYWADHFGFEKVGMPLYGGYAIGYQVVKAYLERTGNSIEAATFLPADEIVAESGYFAA